MPIPRPDYISIIRARFSSQTFVSDLQLGISMNYGHLEEIAI